MVTTSTSLRGFVVARTGAPHADAQAALLAHALAERVGDVEISGADDAALDARARDAAAVFAGVQPRLDPFALASRLGVPVVVAPERVRPLDVARSRSVVAAVRDRGDAPFVAAAGTLADALDVQLVLAHVLEPPSVAALGAPFVPGIGPPSDGGGAVARELLGAVADAAGRSAPGRSCPRVVEGPRAETLEAVAVDEAAAMIAIRAPRRGRLAAAILGSVPRDLVRTARIPVLVWPRHGGPATRSQPV